MSDDMFVALTRVAPSRPGSLDMATVTPPAAAIAIELEAPALPQQLLHRTWTRILERAIGNAAELVGAVVVFAELWILGANVFARYILHNPLVWGDELATSLFIWLTMMGAVGAYRRDQHLRLTALLRRVPPHVRSALETISTVVVAVFCFQLLAALLWPPLIPQRVTLAKFFAATYIGQEMIDFLPALGIPRSFMLLAVVVGLAMMLAMAVLRLIDGRPKTVVSVLVVTIMLAVLAYAGRDVFAALGNLNLLLFFVGFVGVEVAIGVPISFTFGMATLSYLSLSTYVPLSVMAGMMEQATGNMVLLAAPMFVLLGLVMEGTGMARRIVDAISAFVGHRRGGLYLSEVGAMFLVSGISGSKLADMAAVAPVLFPEMARRGYSRGEMSALLATSGAAMELIPPSLLLIIIGAVCNLSIAALFTAGMLPATLASAFLVVVSLRRSRRERVELAQRVNWRRRTRLLIVALPAFILPFLIRFLVVTGVATATEVSTVGVIYTLFVGIALYRDFDWRNAYPILRKTANLTGSILLIVAMANGMSWALTQSGFAGTLTRVLEHAPGGQVTFWALSMLLFIVLGSALEGIPVIVLFGTLLFPIARAAGINEIHFAIAVVLAMSIGLFAPPIGVGFYQSCAFGGVDPDLVVRATLPYIAALMVALLLIIAIPWISIGFL